MNVVHLYENSGGEGEQLATARVSEPEDTAMCSVAAFLCDLAHSCWEFYPCHFPTPPNTY